MLALIKRMFKIKPEKKSNGLTELLSEVFTSDTLDANAHREALNFLSKQFSESKSRYDVLDLAIKCSGYTDHVHDVLITQIQDGEKLVYKIHCNRTNRNVTIIVEGGK